jgi:hypothetical protein
MNNMAENAQLVIAEKVQDAPSKSWQLKLLELATKIEIDLNNGAKAGLFLDALNKINPQPSKTLQALVYAVNGETKLAKEELSKENEVLLNESFLKQSFSPNTILLIQKIKK